eukprot:4448395-Amphidinium_carterae.1
MVACHTTRLTVRAAMWSCTSGMSLASTSATPHIAGQSNHFVGLLQYNASSGTPDHAESLPLCQ